MSDFCRQRTLERRRQRYRERRAAETPVEIERRLQNERAWHGEGGDQADVYAGENAGQLRKGKG